MKAPYQEQFHIRAVEMVRECGKLEQFLHQVLASVDGGEYHKTVGAMSEANYYASKLAADLDVGELAVWAVIESKP